MNLWKLFYNYVLGKFWQWVRQKGRLDLDRLGKGHSQIHMGLLHGNIYT